MIHLLVRWRQLLVLTLLLLCSVGELFARPLSEREARHLAEQFFQQSTHTTKSRPISQQGLQLVSAPVRETGDLQLRTATGEAARYYYIYNRDSNAGFVIIAGDDELTPYIGYATTGQCAVDNMPVQLAAFLKACQERIDELTSHVGLHSSLQPTRPRSTEPTRITPLLGNIQWDQSAPWNNQTPVVGGEHTPVGCVATAYTQVMRYHQWPTQGQGTFSYTEKKSGRQHSVDYGSTTYDWANMPERYDDPSQATDEETKALSTLAYHAGVAVEMMYAPGGSGTYTPLVARALRDHFRYDKRVCFKKRINYTQASWEQLLRNELIASRPIVYSGDGSGGGHAFVCDGYDAEGLFHINWGWGGMSDGYFNLNYLVPSSLGIGGGAGGGFSFSQGAVVGIMPDRAGTSQRTESSVVTTWSFNMSFDKGTLDAVAKYQVALLEDTTPYDDLITYGVTRVGTTDTTYLEEYGRKIPLKERSQVVSISPQRLSLGKYIGVGTWDFFLAYRATNDSDSTSWRPCGQDERAKDQYRRTFSISQESDGSYTATKDASSNEPKLELVAGSAQSNIVGYEKSKVTLQLRNTRRVEFFDQLFLSVRKDGGQWQKLSNILSAIDAEAVETVTFDVDRFPYGSGDVELRVGYFVDKKFSTLWSGTTSIQSASERRTAYIFAPDQHITASLSSGEFSPIRIRNIGTTLPKNQVCYRLEIIKNIRGLTYWTPIYLPAGEEVSLTPNLKELLDAIEAKDGDQIDLTVKFAEFDDNDKIVCYIPLLGQDTLSVTCTNGPLIGDGVITMTTAKAVGEKVLLGIKANGNATIQGVSESLQSDGRSHYYTLTDQTITIRGNVTRLVCDGIEASGSKVVNPNKLTNLDVSGCKSLRELICSNNLLTQLNVTQSGSLTSLDCSNNQLTSLDLSACRELHYLDCYLNQITDERMTQLVKSLPDRQGKDPGVFVVVSDAQDEGNHCLVADVAIAKAKNWKTRKVELSTYNKIDYEGEDNSTPEIFAITLTKEGEGTLTATGADNLNAVLYGTKLTIVATPADGYELTALTANGKNILDTKQFTVKEATEVKATFTKKTFAVTLTKEGEVTLTATGADDLNAVPYGTELTIVATPADGYELTALTANGEDILDSKHVTVTEATTVKATFSKKSSSLKVTLTKEGEGTLTATGADDLNAVPYGTELTIVVTPADGYELTALTANGEDISATKKVVVTESLTVKATFAKKSFAVTLTKEGEGNLTATGANDLNAVPYGTELTIVATPADGYELTALTANGEDILDSKQFTVTEATTVKATFSKKSSSFKVTLTKEGEGTLTATGADDLNAVPYGTELTIVATPAEGYELTALTANGEDILDSKHVTVTEATTVKATFARKSFAVTLTKEGKGNLTATGADDLNAVPYGTELTIVATPAEGYELAALTANGEDILSSKQFTVKEDTEVKATFAKKSFAVTLTKEGEGNLTATGADDLNAVPYGTELTIVATPAEGYELAALTANGEDILSSKQFTVKEDTEVKATFTKKTFAVKLTKEGEGNLTAMGADNLNSVPYGTEITIVATPADGYELTALTANGEDILDTKQFTVKEATEVKATFTKKTFAVTLTKEGEGNLTATGADNLNSVPYGTEITIVATPAEGYELTALTANGEDILDSKQFTVKEATEVKATFTKKTFAVMLTKEGEGNLTATGADDLNAVPYGTELTIVATPAEGYELTALTANGEDILDTKRCTITEATTIEATFVDHTNVVTVGGHAVRIYPNPAKTFVLIEGLQPDSQVMLYSMEGEQLYAGHTDRQGVLQIDLTALSDGVYLLVGQGWQKRLVVKQ